MGFLKGAKELFLGKGEKNYQQSLLGPEQQANYQQYQNAIANPGAGGAAGTTADYYRDLLSNDSQTMAQLSAPELRRFNEDIIPGLSEQFAGMGAGGLSSSGFRNAAVNAGTDLSERLGAMRASLRSQGAAGLQNMTQFGLGQFNENIHRPETFGFLGNAIEGAGKAAGSLAVSKIPGLR